MTTKLKKTTEKELLRVMAKARPIGVDRKSNIIHGYVVMKSGVLEDRPGEVDETTLNKVIELGNRLKQGVKSRFSHPTESNDGLGKYLGRAKNLFMSDVVTREGETVPAARADLHIDPTAMQPPPNGGGTPLGEYIMNLAESDPDALSSSIVARMRREYRLEKDGSRQKAPDGEDLPPLLRVESLMASDIVDEGAAVDGIFSLDDLPNSILWKATEYLNKTFEGMTREELTDRVKSWFEKYLDGRYGPEESEIELFFSHNSTVADGEPDWGTVDKESLPRMAFADEGDADKKSTWGYPHHWVKGGTEKDDMGIWTNGTLFLHRGGLNAAWSAAHGARSGQKASQAVIDHLAAHRRALGMEDDEGGMSAVPVDLLLRKQKLRESELGVEG